MCGHRSLLVCLVIYSVETEIYLNAWTPELPVLHRGSVCLCSTWPVVGEGTHRKQSMSDPQPGSLHLPQPSLVAYTELQSQPEEGTWGFSVFPGHVHNLLESQEYFRTSQSPVSQNISVPSLSSLAFGCSAFVPRVFCCCRREQLKHLPVIVFHKMG